jgi:uncharacterized protein YqfB (UPF0267 family)
MLTDLGWLKQVKIKDSEGNLINPSTNEKLDELKDKLQAIYEAVDGLEVTTDNISVDAGTINLSTDELESKLQALLEAVGIDTGSNVLTELQSVVAQLDVALSTRASEYTLGEVKGILDDISILLTSMSALLDVALSTRASEVTLQAVLEAIGTESGTTVLAELQSVLGKLDVNLSTRASENTLIQVRDYLDTVETKLQSLIDKFDVNLSTRASETTLGLVKTNLDNILTKLDVVLSTRASETTVNNIYNQLNITLSTLRDTITGISPNNKTLKDINDTLLLIKSKTDNLDVTLSTRASEYTLALIKTKTDNLDTLLSSRLADTTFTGRVGEVQVTPTQYTVLARLKDLWDKLGTFLTVKLYDKDANGITSKDETLGIRSLDVNIRSGTVVISPSATNITTQLLFEQQHSSINSGEWQEVLSYTVPTGYNLNILSFEGQSHTANESIRAVYKNILGTFNCLTNEFSDSNSFILPKFATRLYLLVTSNIGSGVNDIITITYTNLNGTTGRTATVTIPKSSLTGTRLEVLLQSGDNGILDITNIIHSATGQAGAFQISGYIELLYLTLTSANTQYQSASIALGGIVILEGQTVYLQYLSSTKTAYIRRLNLLTALITK